MCRQRLLLKHLCLYDINGNKASNVDDHKCCCQEACNALPDLPGPPHMMWMCAKLVKADRCGDTHLEYCC